MFDDILTVRYIVFSTLRSTNYETNLPALTYQLITKITSQKYIKPPSSSARTDKSLNGVSGDEIGRWMLQAACVDVVRGW